jgi:hypothetical protein
MCGGQKIMLILRALALSLFLISSLGVDVGCGIDPNGGGAMDPNGAATASADTDYSACLDPNGRCRG